MTNNKTYMIEAVVDGMWNWYEGRSELSRLSGGTLWSTTDDRAARFTSRRDAEREQKRIGGTTFIREK